MLVVALCSFRTHFIKHLSLISTCQPHRRLTTHFPYTIPPPLTSASFFYGRLNFNYFFSVNATSSYSSSSSSPPDTPAASSLTSPYLSVQIRCSTRYFADMLSEALLCFGASSTSIDEPNGSNQNQEVCVSSIYAISQDVHSSILHAADSIGMKDAPTYQVVMNYHSDWIKQTQESFHPVEVTQGLWIVPEWRTPPDLQATNIILNPGLAFGTGDHPTTKLCLLLLHGLVEGGESFLDYGTGSGILAIAALKFGAALSVGFDIDPLAITAARHNATLNDIGPEVLKLHLVPGADDHSLSTEVTATEDLEGQNSNGTIDTYGTDKYDIVVANILLNPLLDLADLIVSYAKPGAVVALSGIISEQVPRIIERYSEFLEGIAITRLDDWACVRGTKKQNCTLN